MDKKKGVWSQIIIILVIGLLVSGIIDQELLNSLKVIWAASDLELLLERLSLGLGFLTLVLLLIWLVIRAARKE